MLHRNDAKPEGDTWGLPAGKIDEGESKEGSMVREIFEETGCEILPSQLEYLDKLYVKYLSYSFIYHMFRVKLSNRPEIKIDPKEHKDYKWMKPSEALNSKLIEDLDECIKLSYNL